MAAAAASRGASSTLELGGKNPLIVCPDWTDVEEASRVACGANYFNAGQLCVAASRVFIPDAMHDAFVSAAVARASARVLGDQWTSGTEVRVPSLADCALGAQRVGCTLADCTLAASDRRGDWC